MHSYRGEVWRYSSYICDDIPGLNLLHAPGQSVVCDHQVYCAQNPPFQSEPEPCWSSLNNTKRGASYQYHLHQMLLQGNPLSEPPPLSAHALQTDLFLAVISHSGHPGVRQAFRKHFQAMSTNAGEGRGPRLVWRFFVGSKNVTTELQTAVATERQQHADVVVLDADDRSENLVHKITAAMRWTAAHVRSGYVVKMDEDVFVNPGALWRRLRAVQFPQNRLLAGSVVPVHSHPKWRIPRRVYRSKVVPRYAHSQIYVVSLDVARYLGRYQEITALHPFPREDVFVGLAVADTYVYARSIRSPVVRETGGTLRRFDDVPFLVRLDREVDPHDLAISCAVYPIKHPSRSFALLRHLAMGEAGEPSAEDVLLRLRKVEDHAITQLHDIDK